MHLRPDSLALMLHMANISAQSRVLLVENTKGLLAGALIERSVPHILRVNLGVDGGVLKGNNEILVQYNFGEGSVRKISQIASSILMAHSVPGFNSDPVY